MSVYQAEPLFLWKLAREFMAKSMLLTLLTFIRPKGSRHER